MFIEYAKANPEDILCRITAINRGPEAAPIHVLPHLWYRNRWSWEPDGERRSDQSASVPARRRHARTELIWATLVVRAGLGWQPVELLFTENETNFQRIDNAPNTSPYVKDGIHDSSSTGKPSAVNRQQGSKLAGHANRSCPPAAVTRSRFASRRSRSPNRLPISTPSSPPASPKPTRFTTSSTRPSFGADEQLVGRQAFAGLLWSKQYYHYDV